MAILLDTHAFLWLVGGDEALAATQRDFLEAAAARGDLRLPVIAVWEMAMLARKGRLRMRDGFSAWIDAALSHPGVEVTPLTPAIAIESNFLPGALDGDPADRMIVATARLLDMTLATRDREILRYAGDGFLAVYPV